MAWGLSDLVALMDRWGVWKEVRENTEKVPELERRIAALEERLTRAPGEACPSCGALEFRSTGTGPVPGGNSLARRAGARTHIKECGACGFKDRVVVYPPGVLKSR